MEFEKEGITKKRLTRRQMLLALGAGAASIAAAACAGAPAAAPTAAPKAAEPTKPAAGATPGTAAAPTAAPAAAPAVLKGTTLAFLGGTYFIPEAQKLFVDQMNQWGKDNGVTVSADFLSWPDLQAKIAASIQAGGGTDIFDFWPGWSYLYADNLVDMTDFVNTVETRDKGFYDWVTKSTKAKGKWWSVPIGATNGAINYRVSYLKQVGADKFPDTWDELFAVGKKLKAIGKPIGQALGHSTGDPPGFAYPYIWSFGAMEVAEDGKTIAFNKPEFVDAMKRFIQGWKDGFDTTGTAWDDSANNRAFLSDQISITYNGSSIYETAKKDAPTIAEDMDHADMCAGPAGRFYQLGSRSFGVLKGSKNVAGAKDFIQWWMDPLRFDAWIRLQGGYMLPPSKKWDGDPLLIKDPKYGAFARQAKFGRTVGWAGELNEKAALSFSKYIVVDTFAKAITDGDAAAAIKWGADQLQQIYGG